MAYTAAPAARPTRVTHHIGARQSPRAPMKVPMGDWRATMWFVTAVGLAVGVAVYAMLPHVPALPAVTLRQRLAPLRDSRVVLTLLTTLAAYAGMFAVYTYIGVTFDRVTGGSPGVLAGLLLMELGLLQDRRLDATLADGSTLTLDGFMVVDEKRYAELTDAQILQLHKNG
eukprot:gene51205-69692_t